MKEFRCQCGDTLGVITENGLMIGDVIIPQQVDLKCTNCGMFCVYQKDCSTGDQWKPWTVTKGPNTYKDYIIMYMG